MTESARYHWRFCSESHLWCPEDEFPGLVRLFASQTFVSRLLNGAFLTIALAAFTAPASLAQNLPDKDYLVYVVSESADKIALIRFGPKGARTDHDLQTGDMPVDIDGPHGIVVSPDRQLHYVPNAHRRPFGLIWQHSM